MRVKMVQEVSVEMQFFDRIEMLFDGKINMEGQVQIILRTQGFRDYLRKFESK